MSRKLSQVQKDAIKVLEEIWFFYEGDKLSLIDFLRRQHKEDHYTGDRSKIRKEEVERLEQDLNSKRLFIKKAKQMIRK